MEVAFNERSWHLRLYQYSYKTENMPKNLCPYFWAVLIAIPMLPFSVLGYLNHKYLSEECEPFKAYSGQPVFLGGLVHCIIFLLVLVFFAASLFMIVLNIKAVIIALGTVLVFFAGVFGLTRIGQNFAFAKIKKMCPSITWNK